MSNRRPPSGPSGSGSARRTNARRPAASGRPSTRREARSPTRPAPRTSTRSASNASAALDSLMAQKRSIVIEGTKKTRQVSLHTVVILVILIGAVALLVPTLNKYMEQQHALRAAQAELEEVLDHNAELEEQLRLWNDDEYVKAQARGRLGYVVPGETLYVITDTGEGTAAERLEARTQELQRSRRAITPWYITMWDAISVAGEIDADGIVDNPDAVPMISPSASGAPDAGTDSSPSPSTSAASPAQSSAEPSPHTPSASASPTPRSPRS